MSLIGEKRLSSPANPWSAARSLWFAHRRYVWWVLRGCLLAYLVLDALIGLVLVPREASVADLTSDLAAGRVTSLTQDNIGSGRFTPYTWARVLDDESGTALLWHTGDWRPSVALVPAGRHSYSTPVGVPSVRTDAEAAGVAMMNGSLDVFSREQRTFPLAFFGLLAVLVIGQQPRRATKWAWLWLWLLPWNIGLLWWVLRDHPWSERMRLTAQPPPAKERRAGDLRTRAGSALVMLAMGAVAAELLTAGRSLPLG